MSTLLGGSDQTHAFLARAAVVDIESKLSGLELERTRVERAVALATEAARAPGAEVAQQLAAVGLCVLSGDRCNAALLAGLLVRRLLAEQQALRDDPQRFQADPSRFSGNVLTMGVLHVLTRTLLPGKSRWLVGLDLDEKELEADEVLRIQDVAVLVDALDHDEQVVRGTIARLATDVDRRMEASRPRRPTLAEAIRGAASELAATDHRGPFTGIGSSAELTQRVAEVARVDLPRLLPGPEAPPADAPEQTAAPSMDDAAAALLDRLTNLARRCDGRPNRYADDADTLYAEACELLLVPRVGYSYPVIFVGSTPDEDHRRLIECEAKLRGKLTEWRDAVRRGGGRDAETAAAQVGLAVLRLDRALRPFKAEPTAAAPSTETERTGAPPAHADRSTRPAGPVADELRVVEVECGYDEEGLFRLFGQRPKSRHGAWLGDDHEDTQRLLDLRDGKPVRMKRPAASHLSNKVVHPVLGGSDANFRVVVDAPDDKTPGLARIEAIRKGVVVRLVPVKAAR